MMNRGMASPSQPGMMPNGPSQAGMTNPLGFGGMGPPGPPMRGMGGMPPPMGGMGTSGGMGTGGGPMPPPPLGGMQQGPPPPLGGMSMMHTPPTGMQQGQPPPFTGGMGGGPPGPSGNGPRTSIPGTMQIQQQMQQQNSQNRIDPTQIPRPLAQPPSAPQVFDTRAAGQHNLPPAASSRFIVRDRGSAGPRFMRSTLNHVCVLTAHLNGYLMLV